MGERGHARGHLPEWQATEYAQARLDLQTEVAQGTTLNDIRRRYNQPVVPGDDEPVVIDFATHARTQNNVVQIHTEPDAKADADRARLSEDAATAAAAAEADPPRAPPPPPPRPPPPRPWSAPSSLLRRSRPLSRSQRSPRRRRRRRRPPRTRARRNARRACCLLWRRWRSRRTWWTSARTCGGEDAGKPDDTPPEWQEMENAMARLDLQVEVLEGASLNDIRRRYNQEPVAGDDGRATRWTFSEALAKAKRNPRTTSSRHLRGPGKIAPRRARGVGRAPPRRRWGSTWRLTSATCAR